MAVGRQREKQPRRVWYLKVLCAFAAGMLAVLKRLRQVEYRTQAADHPILWAAEESYYLKFYIFQVCDEK